MAFAMLPGDVVPFNVYRIHKPTTTFELLASFKERPWANDFMDSMRREFNDTVVILIVCGELKDMGEGTK